MNSITMKPNALSLQTNQKTNSYTTVPIEPNEAKGAEKAKRVRQVLKGLAHGVGVIKPISRRTL